MATAVEPSGASAASLADRVRHVMEQYGITASDITAQTGITANLLARWLHQHFVAKRSVGCPQPSEIDSLLPQIEQRMARWLTRATSRAKRHHSHIAAPADEAAGASDFILPLRLELTVLQPSMYKYGASVASLCDNLLWDVRSTLSPRDFLRQTLRDLNVDQPEVWIGPLETLMVSQIEEHKQKLATSAAGSATAAALLSAQPAEPSPASEGNVGTSEASIRFIRVPLDIIDHDVRLRDSSVIWDLEHPNADPDAFGVSFAQDAGLPAEFAVKIAWSIRKQIATHRVATAAGAKTAPANAVTEDELEFGVLRTPEVLAECGHRIGGLTRRHEVAVHQQAPPPYIAYFTPSSHRHPFYVGEVIDAMHLPAPPTVRALLGKTSDHPTAAPLAPPTPPAMDVKRKAKVTSGYEFLSCTAEKLRVRLRKVVQISVRSTPAAAGSRRKPTNLASLTSSSAVDQDSAPATPAGTAPSSPAPADSMPATPMVDDDESKGGPTPMEVDDGEADRESSVGIVEEMDDEEAEEQKR
jgi:hypothetical protein